MELLRANGKLETIKRLRQRINEIMFYAVNIGLIEANPAVKFKNAFESPKKDKYQQSKHKNYLNLCKFLQWLELNYRRVA